jgi:hypothetical protein
MHCREMTAMSHTKDVHWQNRDRMRPRDDQARDATKSLNVTEEELRHAVANVGTSAKKLIEYIRSQRADIP